MSSDDLHQVKELTLAEAYRRIEALERRLNGLARPGGPVWGGEPGQESYVALPGGKRIPIGMKPPAEMIGSGSIQTFTGLEFTPMEPQGHLITVRDVAHALSQTCRYGGHTTRFYSVAEHVVLMARALMAAGATQDEVLWALHHDDPEAYIGDLVRPLKRSFPSFSACEDRIMALVRARFDMASHTMPARVVEADNRILIDERAQALAPTEKEWGYGGATDALGVTIEFWEPRRAEWEYIRLHNALSGEDVPLPVWPAESGWAGSDPTPPATEPAPEVSDEIPEQFQRIIDAVQGGQRPRQLPAFVQIQCSRDPVVTRAQMEYNVTRTAEGYAASIGGRVSELSMRHESGLDERGMIATVADFTVVPLPDPDTYKPKYDPASPPTVLRTEKIRPDPTAVMGLAMGLALGGDVSLLRRLAEESPAEVAEALGGRTSLEARVSEEMLERIDADIKGGGLAKSDGNSLSTARSALGRIRAMVGRLRVEESEDRPDQVHRRAEALSKIEDLAIEAFCETSPAWNPEPQRGVQDGAEGTVAAASDATPPTAVPSVPEAVHPDEAHERGFNHGLEYALQLFKVPGSTSSDVFETIHETRYGVRPADPAPQLDPLGRDFVEAAIRIMKAYPGFEAQDYLHEGITADDFESMLTEDMEEAWREVERFRDQVVILVTAVADVERKLTNMQPHIEQACLPGRAGFLDNYVDPCLQILQAVTGRLSGLDYRSYLPALERVAEAAGEMPRQTPDSGGAATEHSFGITAGAVWNLDRALDNLAAIRAGYTNRAAPRGSLVGAAASPTETQIPGPALAVAIDKWGAHWVANEAGGLLRFAEAFTSLSGAEVRRQRYNLRQLVTESPGYNDTDEAVAELVDRITEVFRPIKTGA